MCNAAEHAFKEKSAKLLILLPLRTIYFQTFQCETPCSNKNINTYLLNFIVQWNLDLRKPDLRKNLDLRKIVGTTDFLVHNLFDLRKIFSQKMEKIGTFWQF